MFDEIKKKIALFMIKRNFIKNRKQDTILYNTFLTDSVNYFIIVPGKETKFDVYFEIAEYLEKKDKEVTFLLSQAQNEIRSFEKKGNLILYTEEDKNKIFLPKKVYTDQLKTLEFDVVINAADEDDLFCMALANMVKSKYRIGVESLNADLYYNFQLKGVSPDRGDLLKKLEWAFRMF